MERFLLGDKVGNGGEVGCGDGVVDVRSFWGWVWVGHYACMLKFYYLCQLVSLP